MLVFKKHLSGSIDSNVEDTYETVRLRTVGMAASKLFNKRCPKHIQIRSVHVWKEQESQLCAIRAPASCLAPSHSDMYPILWTQPKDADPGMKPVCGLYALYSTCFFSCIIHLCFAQQRCADAEMCVIATLGVFPQRLRCGMTSPKADCV
jgi:hypothetical protein